KPSAYLGGARAGVRIEDPEKLDELIAPLERRSRSVLDRDEQPLGSFEWMIRVPQLHPRLLKENLGYFLWGRHTGLLLYMPFAVVAVLFFLLNNRRSSTSWVLFASLTATALFFLIWIHYNWHGGSGFIGNRYFAGAYPAFLFLVGRIRPKGLIVAGSVAAGLFLAPVLFAPYGAPVPDPTLQFHTRSSPFELFPVELSLWHKVPGYESMAAHGVIFSGRRDLVEVPDTGSGSMWVRGAARTEVWARSAKPLESLLFEVSSPAPDNEIVLQLGKERHRILSDGSPSESVRPSLVEFRPKGETKLWYQYGKPVHSYRLEASVLTGRNPRRENGELIQPQFYIGAQIDYLGTREELSRKDRFRMAWAKPPPIASVATGDRFEAIVGLQNLSNETWPTAGALPVKVAHRWFDSSGKEIAVGDLAELPRRVTPRSWAQVAVKVQAPAQAGDYVLELDVVREGLARFSERGAPKLRLEVDVSLSPTSSP
ncbi:MAG: hypothetical protein OES47_11780, partial [Acidobacteriota bacterium]|nr:hypothetical protein [Acidobacteriota bacterium]